MIYTTWNISSYIKFYVLSALVIVCKIVFSAAASITKAISNLKHGAHKLDAIIS